MEWSMERYFREIPAALPRAVKEKHQRPTSVRLSVAIPGQIKQIVNSVIADDGEGGLLLLKGRAVRTYGGERAILSNGRRA